MSAATGPHPPFPWASLPRRPACPADRHGTARRPVGRRHRRHRACAERAGQRRGPRELRTRADDSNRRADDRERGRHRLGPRTGRPARDPRHRHERAQRVTTRAGGRHSVHAAARHRHDSTFSSHHPRPGSGVVGNTDLADRGPYGPELDVEGAVSLDGGDFLVVSEGSAEAGSIGGPFIHRFDATATFQAAFEIPSWYVPDAQGTVGFAPFRGPHGIDRRPGTLDEESSSSSRRPCCRTTTPPSLPNRRSPARGVRRRDGRGDRRMGLAARADLS